MRTLDKELGTSWIAERSEEWTPCQIAAWRASGYDPYAPADAVDELVHGAAKLLSQGVVPTENRLDFVKLTFKFL